MFKKFFPYVFIFLLQDAAISPNSFGKEMKSQTCEQLNGKVLAYIDLVFYMQDCVLREINDPSILNSLTQLEGKKIQTLSKKEYQGFSLGPQYTQENYDHDFLKREKIENICKKYEKKIVTSNNIDFYYIQSCKKRHFSSYEEATSFNIEMRPILSLPQSILSHFATGKMMKDKNDESDLKWKTALEIAKNLPDSRTLCKDLNKLVVSYHQNSFFLMNCILHPIKDLNLTIQMKADSLGRIRELSTEQRLGIPEGSPIDGATVLKELN